MQGRSVLGCRGRPSECSLAAHRVTFASLTEHVDCHRRRPTQTLALAMLACFVGACTSTEPPYIADTAGVVESKEPVPNGLSYRLTTGETFVAPSGSTYLGGS